MKKTTLILLALLFITPMFNAYADGISVEFPAQGQTGISLHPIFEFSSTFTIDTTEFKEYSPFNPHDTIGYVYDPYILVIDDDTRINIPQDDWASYAIPCRISVNKTDFKSFCVAPVRALRKNTTYSFIFEDFPVIIEDELLPGTYDTVMIDQSYNSHFTTINELFSIVDDNIPSSHIIKCNYPVELTFSEKKYIESDHLDDIIQISMVDPINPTDTVVTTFSDIEIDIELNADSSGVRIEPISQLTHGAYIVEADLSTILGDKRNNFRKAFYVKEFAEVKVIVDAEPQDVNFSGAHPLNVGRGIVYLTSGEYLTREVPSLVDDYVFKKWDNVEPENMIISGNSMTYFTDCDNLDDIELRAVYVPIPIDTLEIEIPTYYKYGNIVYDTCSSFTVTGDVEYLSPYVYTYKRYSNKPLKIKMNPCDETLFDNWTADYGIELLDPGDLEVTLPLTDSPDEIDIDKITSRNKIGAVCDFDDELCSKYVLSLVVEYDTDPMGGFDFDDYDINFSNIWTSGPNDDQRTRTYVFESLSPIDESITLTINNDCFEVATIYDDEGLVNWGGTNSSDPKDRDLRLQQITGLTIYPTAAKVLADQKSRPSGFCDNTIHIIIRKKIMKLEVQWDIADLYNEWDLHLPIPDMMHIKLDEIPPTEINPSMESIENIEYYVDINEALSIKEEYLSGFSNTISKSNYKMLYYDIYYYCNTEVTATPYCEEPWLFDDQSQAYWENGILYTDNFVDDQLVPGELQAQDFVMDEDRKIYFHFEKGFTLEYIEMDMVRHDTRPSDDISGKGTKETHRYCLDKTDNNRLDSWAVLEMWTNKVGVDEEDYNRGLILNHNPFVAPGNFWTKREYLTQTGQIIFYFSEPIKPIYFSSTAQWLKTSDALDPLYKGQNRPDGTPTLTYEFDNNTSSSWRNVTIDGNTVEFQLTSGSDHWLNHMQKLQLQFTNYDGYTDRPLSMTDRPLSNMKTTVGTTDILICTNLPGVKITNLEFINHNDSHRYSNMFVYQLSNFQSLETNYQYSPSSATYYDWDNTGKLMFKIGAKRIPDFDPDEQGNPKYDGYNHIYPGGTAQLSNNDVWLICDQLKYNSSINIASFYFDDQYAERNTKSDIGFEWEGIAADLTSLGLNMIGIDIESNDIETLYKSLSGYHSTNEKHKKDRYMGRVELDLRRNALLGNYRNLYMDDKTTKIDWMNWGVGESGFYELRGIEEYDKDSYEVIINMNDGTIKRRFPKPRLKAQFQVTLGHIQP